MAGIGGVIAVGGAAVATTTWLSSRQHLENNDQESWDQLRPVNNAAVGAAAGGVVIGLGGVVWGVAF